jgi:hypothetical protein
LPCARQAVHTSIVLTQLSHQETAVFQQGNAIGAGHKSFGHRAGEQCFLSVRHNLSDTAPPVSGVEDACAGSQNALWSIQR